MCNFLSLSHPFNPLISAACFPWDLGAQRGEDARRMARELETEARLERGLIAESGLSWSELACWLSVALP